MIIDGHAKLGKSFNQKGRTVEEYLQEMEKNNINKAIICANKPISYRVEEGNEYIENILKEYPSKFIGGLRLDPWRGSDMKKELENRKGSGFKFIYLNPWEEQFQVNSSIVNLLIEMAEDNNMPVIIEAGYPWTSHITQIVDIARRFPKTAFLATNAGQLDLSASTLDDVRLAMEKADNLFLGTAGACGAEWLQSLAQNYRKRVFFESGFSMMEPYLEKFRIQKGFFSEEIKNEIFCECLLDILK